MDLDKVEIISEQLLSLKELWHLLRSSSLDKASKEKAEELLLHIFDMKQMELQHCIGS